MFQDGSMKTVSSASRTQLVKTHQRASQVNHAEVSSPQPHRNTANAPTECVLSYPQSPTAGRTCSLRRSYREAGLLPRQKLMLTPTSPQTDHDALCKRRNPRDKARMASSASLLTISSTFHSLFKVLFIFPSRYLFAIGLSPVFSFGWNLPPV